MRLRADVDARINKIQGGVPTFFDAYLARLIDRLASTEPIHRWSCQAEVAPGTEQETLASALQWLDDFLARRDHERLVPYGARRAIDPRYASEIGPFEMMMSQGLTRCLEWQGLPLFKSVYEFAIVPMLLYELRPATILEIGSGAGASAKWMADVCASTGLTTRILSVDIQRVAVGGREGIEFYQGDANVPESLFGMEVLRTAAHPWLLIEDAHVNVGAVLRHFDQYLRRGDYLIVEDSRDKHDALGAFVTDRYRVDTRYTDFFGRNATSAEDAIFSVTA